MLSLYGSNFCFLFQLKLILVPLSEQFKSTYTHDERRVHSSTTYICLEWDRKATQNGKDHNDAYEGFNDGGRTLVNYMRMGYGCRTYQDIYHRVLTVA